jgi:molybdopterin-guanine dinucleotide biosynthesis protein B
VTPETALPVAHLDDIPAIAAMMQRSALSVEDILAQGAGADDVR